MGYYKWKPKLINLHVNENAATNLKCSQNSIADLRQGTDKNKQKQRPETV